MQLTWLMKNKIYFFAINLNKKKNNFYKNKYILEENLKIAKFW